MRAKMWNILPGPGSRNREDDTTMRGSIFRELRDFSDDISAEERQVKTMIDLLLLSTTL
jgi:hypothetical protein